MRRLEDGRSEREKQQREQQKEQQEHIMMKNVGNSANADNDNVKMSSPGNNDSSNGIDQSWLLPTNNNAITPTSIDDHTTNTNNNNADKDDWISGWITPGSDRSNSPTESLGSMEGSLSVMTPGSSSMGSLGSTGGIGGSGSMGGIGGSGSMGGSIGSSLSREERDDKLYPLLHQRPNKIERIKSASKRPVVDKLNLIRTISKMEYDLVHQLNPSLVVANTRHFTQQQQCGGSGTPPSKGRQPAAEEPLTPTTETCDIFSSLKLALGTTEGLNVMPMLLDDAARSSSVDTVSTVPMTPNSLETLPMTPTDANNVSSNGEDDLSERAFSSPASVLTEPTSPASAAARQGRSSNSGIAKPNLVTKRNTCGTIYLGSTLSAPDKDALIKCVCGVFRAHLLQAESTSDVITVSSHHANNNVMMNHQMNKVQEYQIFTDRRSPGDYRHLDTTSIPSLAQITDFYRSIFLRSQMEVDCIIISLIYVERLIKLTAGALTPRTSNWRSILFSCMVLASKVWDDLSMWNCDFSKIGPSGMTFSLSRTNELEIALLSALGYKVKVNASEYAKYYFLLRGMLCRSGLANDDLTRLQPLDVRGAQSLAEGTNASVVAEKNKQRSDVSKYLMKQRSKSYGCFDDKPTTSDNVGNGGGSGATTKVVMPPQSSPTSQRVSLEQIVRM